MTAPGRYSCQYHPCPRVFDSAQAVRAHVRFCPYRRPQASPRAEPRQVPRRVPVPPASGSGQPPENDVIAMSDVVALAREVLRREEQHARRCEQLVRQIVSEVVQPHPELPPATTSAARAAAEAALAGVPEAWLLLRGRFLAAKARDGVYGPAVEAQRREARARDEAERRRQEDGHAPPSPAAPPPPGIALPPATAGRSPDPRRQEEAERRGQEEEAAERKGALVQHGLDVVREDLDKHDDLDDEARAEVWEETRRALEERLSGAASETDAEAIADEVLTDEFGDDDLDEDDQEDDEEEHDSDEEDK